MGGWVSTLAPEVPPEEQEEEAPEQPEEEAPEEEALEEPEEEAPLEGGEASGEAPGAMAEEKGWKEEEEDE
jgi:hypothetical protein